MSLTLKGEISDFARQHNLEYVETSAKTGSRGASQRVKSAMELVALRVPTDLADTSSTYSEYKR